MSNAKIEQRPSSGIYSPTFGKYRCTLFCYLSGLKGAHDAKISQHVGACRYKTVNHTFIIICKTPTYEFNVTIDYHDKIPGQKLGGKQNGPTMLQIRVFFLKQAADVPFCAYRHRLDFCSILVPQFAWMWSPK